MGLDHPLSRMMTHQLGSSLPAKAGNPVLTTMRGDAGRAYGWAAAYWIIRFRG
jgi:hypothetical protein